MHAVVVILVHLLQNPRQHAGFAAGLKVKINFALGSAASQHTHIQLAGNKADHLADATVLDKVVKARQGKQNVRGFGKFLQRKADILKLLPLADQRVGKLGGIAQGAAAAQGVQHKNFLFGVILQHHIAGCHGGVVAAGQIAADGKGKYLICLQEILSPFLGAGAGAGAGTVVLVHRLQHLRHVQRRQVNILTLAHADLKRSKGKGNAGCRIFQLPNLAGTVGNDHPIHRSEPPFQSYTSLPYYREHLPPRQVNPNEMPHL